MTLGQVIEMEPEKRDKVNLPIVILLIAFVIIAIVIAVIAFIRVKKQIDQGWPDGVVLTEETTVEEIPVDTSTVEVESMEENSMSLEGNIEQFKYDTLSITENSNFSPMSLRFAMLALQAGGNEEVSKLIGEFNQTEDLDTSLDEFQQKMKDLESTGIVEIANGIFADNGLNNPLLLEDYKERMKDKLDMEVKDVNFTNGEGQVEIDQWVNENTNGLIDSFPVDDSTSTAILNALYYKDRWRYFDEERTQKADFNTPLEVKEVDMMYSKLDSSSEYELLEGNGYMQLKLYLEHSTMNVYLPNEKVSLQSMIETLKSGDEVVKNEYDTVYVYLPRFKFDTSVVLTDSLKEYGLSRIFQNEHGMFSNMAENYLVVSDILQKTTIEVNEEGAEAAAVTGIMLRGLSASIAPPVTYEFNANKPFVFEITSEYGETMFIGTVIDPTI